MIPKQQILKIAKELNLLPTTVEKDYAIGWLLRAISINPVLSKWHFKGGTCLKKCYFEVYRFSEDLDFTVSKDQELDLNIIQTNLENVVSWIESNSGLIFPRDQWKIEEYENKRGNPSFHVKISYRGPLGMSTNTLQRIKFDITQDEMVVSKPKLRKLHHGYIDEVQPTPLILCYSINEILAEKTRALVERPGRARDVFDIVNISRNFRNEINVQQTRRILHKKFDFKNLNKPTVENIMNSIDFDSLKQNWEEQLSHQINNLQPVEDSISGLEEFINWLFAPE